jgi:uncharacterized protein (DUF1499 family)
VASERPSVLAAFAAFVAGAGLGLALAGPVLAYSGLVPPFTGFRLFLFGALLCLVGLVLGGLGLRATRGGRPGRDRAWFAVATGSGVLLAVLWAASAGFGLPRINDITTNPDDPPSFEAAAGDPENRERDMSYPPAFAAQQRVAYTDLAPIQLDVPPVDAFERARRAAEALGWQITASDPQRGTLEARQVSGLFRFVDDISIRIRPRSGGSVVDVRSKSRVGQGDLGANAARIRAFAAELVAGGGVR